MTLQEIEDKLRAWAKLDAESKHVNPLARVKAFEDCADALQAERERIERDHEKDRAVLIRAMIENEKIWRSRLEAAGLKP